MRRDEASEGGGREGDLPPSPSQRVRLEVEILTSDIASNAPRSDDRPHGVQQRVVLIVTSNEGLSRYVAHCLGSRAELQLLSVDSVSGALHMARRQQPQLVIAECAARQCDPSNQQRAGHPDCQ